jgi:hypothetical protein
MALMLSVMQRNSGMQGGCGAELLLQGSMLGVAEENFGSRVDLPSLALSPGG